MLSLLTPNNTLTLRDLMQITVQQYFYLDKNKRFKNTSTLNHQTTKKPGRGSQTFSIIYIRFLVWSILKSGPFNVYVSSCSKVTHLGQGSSSNKGLKLQIGLLFIRAVEKAYIALVPRARWAVDEMGFYQ